MKKQQSSSLTQRLLDLANSWREQAEFFEQHGCTANAAAALCHAQELEAVVSAWENQLLSTKQAAAESGYSAEHLRRLARKGELAAQRSNGAKSHIKFRRADLPGKRGGSDSLDYDPEEDARSAAERLRW